VEVGTVKVAELDEESIEVRYVHSVNIT